MLHWSRGRWESRGAALRAPRYTNRCEAPASPRPGLGRGPGSGACRPWPARGPPAGSAAASDKTLSASDMLAGLKQDSRRRAADRRPPAACLPQRGRAIRGPHHLGAGLGGLDPRRHTPRPATPRRPAAGSHRAQARLLARSSRACRCSGDGSRSQLLDPAKQVGLDLRAAQRRRAGSSSSARRTRTIQSALTGLSSGDASSALIASSYRF